jgi:uncharacterized RDD family membrane protein YckC
MQCPACKKEVGVDRFFCTWCEAFIPQPTIGKKAGLFRRWFALVIDPLLGFLLYSVVSIPIVFVIGGAETSVNGSGAATVISLLVTAVAYFLFYFNLLSQGTTPGKWALGEKVVNKEDGGFPGLGRMLLREIVGKIVSGLFFGVGYLWAIFDPDQQAWHDKIAGTVVVHSPSLSPFAPGAFQPEPAPIRPVVAPQPSLLVRGSYCPQCGASALQDSKFCEQCGHTLT